MGGRLRLVLFFRLLPLGLLLCCAFLPLGCKKDKPPPEPLPLFLTEWEADATRIKAREAGELLSESQDYLVYKTVIGDYSGHVTYEFKEGKLVRLVWNISIKKDSPLRDTLEEDVVKLVASHLKSPYYVKASKMWLADELNLVEIQYAKTWGGLSYKTTFYDIKDVRNINIVNLFENLRTDDKWTQGRLE